MELFGYVYIGHRDGLTKIGSTLDPTKRRRQIETASGIKFSNFTVFHTYAYIACERYCLSIVKSILTEGEWFMDKDMRGYTYFIEYLGLRCDEQEQIKDEQEVNQEDE